MTTPSKSGEAKSVASGSGIVKLLAGWITLPLFFLASGGSLMWWQAWVYCAVLLVPMTIFVVYMMRRDPQFLARRLKVREADKTQRRIQLWGSPISFAMLILPGIDYRLGWSSPPLALQIIAMVFALLGYLAVLRVFIENRWAGRTIETYAEQKVITTGPYAVVRHPMYAATLLLFLATPVALGSWWALLPGILLIPMFGLRIRGEEAVLLRDLPDYADYRRKVRYRIVPYVW